MARSIPTGIFIIANKFLHIHIFKIEEEVNTQ